MQDHGQAEPPGGRAASLGRTLVAVLVTVLAALVAAVAWVVGQALYLEDYCLTRVDRPEGSRPEASGGRPAYWRDPVTVACEYDGHGTVLATEPGPLVAALLLAAAVCAVAVTAFTWARREDPAA